jgi:hypothetical protein
MKFRLFAVAIGFMMVWTAGQVFEVSYSQNLLLSICSAIGLAIWFDLHSLIGKQLKKVFCKA